MLKAGHVCDDCKVLNSTKCQQNDQKENEKDEKKTQYNCK